VLETSRSLRLILHWKRLILDLDSRTHLSLKDSSSCVPPEVLPEIVYHPFGGIGSGKSQYKKSLPKFLPISMFLIIYFDANKSLPPICLPMGLSLLLLASGIRWRRWFLIAMPMIILVFVNHAGSCGSIDAFWADLSGPGSKKIANFNMRQISHKM